MQHITTQLTKCLYRVLPRPSAVLDDGLEGRLLFRVVAAVADHVLGAHQAAV